ncbi:glycosyltransferase [Pelotomaculum propionicicum]|nr:glycosyltransferase [Pelotomaculum propionicicum]NLI13371.1 glycosyltransferase [Peptococcaceae bacterium]
MNRKETLSLCMIVKDEEEHILSCINSVKHLVDNIIVVDTGSLDATVKLAMAAGAKIFNCKWTGDFAEARNFALEQAVSDWIMVLDADEILDSVDLAEFNKLLCAPQVEGYFLNIRSYLGTGADMTEDQVVRLFRNNPAYRFSGAIHEQIAPSILDANGGKGLTVAPLTIIHYGYLDAQVSKRDKANRNSQIISRELKNSPDNPFLLYCLAVEHYQKGEISEGLACLEKALVRMRGTEGYFEDVVLNVALGLLNLGEIEKMVDFVSISLKMLPRHPDLFLLKGVGLFSLGKYLEAIEDLERTLETGNGVFFPEFMVHCFLGEAYNLTGNYTRAIKAYLTSLRQNSMFFYPLTQILDLMRRERGIFRFEEICCFAPDHEKRILIKELLDKEEVNLAATVLLLLLYDLNSGVSRFAYVDEISENFARILSQIKSLPDRNVSYNYLAVAAREISLYAKIISKNYNCGNFPARSRLKYLLDKLLLLLISEFCPLRFPPYVTLQSIVAYKT